MLFVLWEPLILERLTLIWQELFMAIKKTSSHVSSAFTVTDVYPFQRQFTLKFRHAYDRCTEQAEKEKKY